MDGIVIHRSRHAQQYVVVPNDIARNTELSFTARGLLVFLLSLPLGWHVTTDMLAEDNPDSRGSIRKAMAELKEAGYVVLVTERGPDGRTRRHLEVFDAPQAKRGQGAFGATSGNAHRPRSHQTPDTKRGQGAVNRSTGLSTGSSTGDGSPAGDPQSLGPVINPLPAVTRARGDDLISMIIEEIERATGRRIGPRWAERIAQTILGGREAASPARYIRRAIRSEPDPRVRFLSLYDDQDRL